MVMFGLVFALLAGFSGVAIDSARKLSAENKLQNITDAASLAGARKYGENKDRSAAIATASTYFAQALQTEKALKGAVLSLADVDEKTMEFRAASNVVLPTTLTRIMGFKTMPIAVSSTAAFSTGDVEVSIMIDLSSSMTGQRFTDTKSALQQFADQVMLDDTDPRPVKIAFAPFASAVNPGAYFATVAGSTAVGGPCVGERNGSARFTEDPPAAGGFFNVFSPESDWPCLDTEIMPLEKSKAVVQARISDLKLSQGTAGHLGTMWAWYMLSPKWAAIWPNDSTPKDYGETTKVAILMTDGENFPKDLPTDEAADDYALQVCTNMKAAGITVYAIGFHVEAKRARDLLESCASSADKHFFPYGSNELEAAFNEIAMSFTALRLTQ